MNDYESLQAAQGWSRPQGGMVAWVRVKRIRSRPPGVEAVEDAWMYRGRRDHGQIQGRQGEQAGVGDGSPRPIWPL